MLTATYPPRAEPLTAEVNCHRCGRQLHMTLDAIRELNDNNKSPDCGCEPAPVVKVKRGRRKMSKAELCLRAVAAWEDARQADVPQPAAVVTVWEDNRQAFGLPGWASSYPDSNRVIMELVKMVGQGKLFRPRKGHYRLTPLGRELLAQADARVKS